MFDKNPYNDPAQSIAESFSLLFSLTHRFLLKTAALMHMLFSA